MSSEAQTLTNFMVIHHKKYNWVLVIIENIITDVIKITLLQKVKIYACGDPGGGNKCWAPLLKSM